MHLSRFIYSRLCHKSLLYLQLPIRGVHECAGALFFCLLAQCMMGYIAW